MERILVLFTPKPFMSDCQTFNVWVNVPAGSGFPAIFQAALDEFETQHLQGKKYSRDKTICDETAYYITERASLSTKP